jgi:hypothetical protein
MLIINSNLSNREAFSIHGQLTEDRMEELLDDSERLEAVSSIDSFLDDISNNLPAEDFLKDEVKILESLAPHMSVEKMEAFLNVIECIKHELRLHLENTIAASAAVDSILYSINGSEA